MYLAKNIRFLRQHIGMTQEALAGKLGIQRTMISAYEDGRSEPKLSSLTILSNVFGVTVDGLMMQDLSSGDVHETPAQPPVRVLAVTVDKEDREGICLVSQKASAGYLNGYSDTEYVGTLPQFQLPNLPSGRTYRAFEISGDSMLPIQPGTIIIGSFLEHIEHLRNGRTYVLVTTNDGVVYKRVFNYLAERGKLFLVSDNELYKPFEIGAQEVIEIWEAKAFISTVFPNPKERDQAVSLEDIAHMIRDLREQIVKTK
jgi:transcriptional regulator with XRE-family HTH domain